MSNMQQQFPTSINLREVIMSIFDELKNMYQCNEIYVITRKQKTIDKVILDLKSLNKIFEKFVSLIASVSTPIFQWSIFSQNLLPDSSLQQRVNISLSNILRDTLKNSFNMFLNQELKTIESELVLYFDKPLIMFDVFDVVCLEVNEFENNINVRIRKIAVLKEVIDKINELFEKESTI